MGGGTVGWGRYGVGALLEVTALFPPLRGIGKQGLQCMGEWDPHPTPPWDPPPNNPPMGPPNNAPPPPPNPKPRSGEGGGISKGGRGHGCD